VRFTTFLVMMQRRGPSIYDVHKNIPFLTPLHPSVHMRLHGPDPSPCGRPHAVNMKYTLLKRLVQWPTGPKAEIRLYDCNLFNCTIGNLYY